MGSIRSALGEYACKLTERRIQPLVLPKSNFNTTPGSTSLYPFGVERIGVEDLRFFGVSGVDAARLSGFGTLVGSD
jgi:hypothetical protein